MFTAIRWIPAGIPIYTFFLLLGPRLHALAKARSYLTVAEFAFDRFAISSHPSVAHGIRILILFSLQLPVFCYVITQFQSVAIEVGRPPLTRLPPHKPTILRTAPLRSLDGFEPGRHVRANPLSPSRDGGGRRDGNSSSAAACFWGGEGNLILSLSFTPPPP